MTRTTTLTSLIAAGFLAATPAVAAVWGEGNIDAYGTILDDLNRPAFVGTSMSMAKPRFDAYHGAFAGSVDLDHSGFAVSAGGPEKSYGPWGHGNVDAYGTVIPRQ